MSAKKNTDKPDPSVSSGTSPTFQRSRHALRVPDAAEYIGATPWYVEELIRNGAIPFRQLGKFRVLDAADLDAFVASVPKQRITKILNGKTFTEAA